MCQARNFLKNGSGIRTQLTQLATLLKALSPDLSHFLGFFSVFGRSLLFFIVWVVKVEYIDAAERQEASNFFFAFRWVIVWFKREFEFDSILRLWEVVSYRISFCDSSLSLSLCLSLSVCLSVCLTPPDR